LAPISERPGGNEIDARITRHASHGISQKRRKRIEECFGGVKDIAFLRKLKHRGQLKVAWIFIFAETVYNECESLIPIPVAADRTVVFFGTIFD
jgi:hypothetical protein